jgi:DHA2 family multidrug resistance protein
MFAPMLGPTLGGYLTEYLSWRWIFYINLVPGLLAAVLSFWVLRDEKPRPIPFDVWGFSLMALSVTTLLLATSQGNTKGWDSDYIVALFAIAAVSFAAYLVTAFWRTHPVIDLRLFKYVTYSAGTIVSIVVGVALFGGVFLLPVFLQNLMGYDAIQTGLLMMPQGLALATVMPLSNTLMRKFDPKVPMIIGMTLLSISLFLQAGMTTDTSTWDILFWTALRGWGLGLTFPPMNQTALGAVPIQKIGQASGLFNVTRQLGGSFGIAALSTLLTQRTVFHQTVLGQDAARNAQAAPLITQLQQTFLHQGMSPDVAMMQAQATFGGMAIKQASVYAFQDCFFAAGVLALVGILPALFMQKPKMPQGPGAAAHAAAIE